jgi:hypothetical protein
MGAQRAYHLLLALLSEGAKKVSMCQMQSKNDQQVHSVAVKNNPKDEKVDTKDVEEEQQLETSSMTHSQRYFKEDVRRLRRDVDTFKSAFLKLRRQGEPMDMVRPAWLAMQNAKDHYFAIRQPELYNDLYDEEADRAFEIRCLNGSFDYIICTNDWKNDSDEDHYEEEDAAKHHSILKFPIVVDGTQSFSRHKVEVKKEDEVFIPHEGWIPLKGHRGFKLNVTVVILALLVLLLPLVVAAPSPGVPQHGKIFFSGFGSPAAGNFMQEHQITVVNFSADTSIAGTLSCNFGGGGGVVSIRAINTGLTPGYRTYHPGVGGVLSSWPALEEETIYGDNLVFVDDQHTKVCMQPFNITVSPEVLYVGLWAFWNYNNAAAISTATDPPVINPKPNVLPMISCTLDFFEDCTPGQVAPTTVISITNTNNENNAINTKIDSKQTAIPFSFAGAVGAATLGVTLDPEYVMHVKNEEDGLLWVQGTVGVSHISQDVPVHLTKVGSVNITGASLPVEVGNVLEVSSVGSITNAIAVGTIINPVTVDEITLPVVIDVIREPVTISSIVSPVDVVFDPLSTMHVNGTVEISNAIDIDPNEEINVKTNPNDPKPIWVTDFRPQPPVALEFADLKKRLRRKKTGLGKEFSSDPSPYAHPTAMRRPLKAIAAERKAKANGTFTKLTHAFGENTELPKEPKLVVETQNYFEPISVDDVYEVLTNRITVGEDNAPENYYATLLKDNFIIVGEDIGLKAEADKYDNNIDMNSVSKKVLAVASQLKGNPQGGGGKGKADMKGEKAEPVDKIAMAKQQMHVVNRLASKVSTYPELLNIALYLALNDDMFFRLYDEAKKKATPMRRGGTASEHILSGMRNGLSPIDITKGMERWSPEIQEAQKRAGWLDGLKSLLKQKSAKSRAEATVIMDCSHTKNSSSSQDEREPPPPPPLLSTPPLPMPSEDKEDHNTIGKGVEFSSDPSPYAHDSEIPRKMEDYNSLVKLSSLYTETGPQIGNYNSPLTYLSAMSSIQGLKARGGPDVNFQAGMTAGYIGANNVKVPYATIPMPEVGMWPLQVRTEAGGILVDNNNEIPFVAVGTTLEPAKPVIAGPIAMQVAEQIERGQSIRGDMTQTSGLLVNELYRLVNAGSAPLGDTPLATMVKLLGYFMTLSVDGKIDDIPFAHLQGKLDGFTIPLKIDPTFEYNKMDGEVKNSGSGGLAQPVFPFGDERYPTLAQMVANPSIPQVRFVLNEQDAPAECETVYFPTEWIYYKDPNKTSLYLCLFIMALTDYPCGLWTVGVTTTNEDDAHEDVQYNIMTTNLINIRGHTNIAIVFPTNSSFRGVIVAANSQLSAKTSVFSGPTAAGNGTTAIAPNTRMFWSTSDDPDHPYHINTFIATWSQQIKATVVADFIGRFVKLTKKSSLLPMAFDALAVMSTYYTPLFEYEPGVDSFLEGNSVAGAALQTFYCQEPQTTLAFNDPDEDNPLPNEYSYMLPEMSFDWWNTIASGLFSAVPDDAGYDYETGQIRPDYLKTKQGYLMLLLRARDYAANMTAYYQMYGQSVEMWDSMWTNPDLEALALEMQTLYSYETKGSDGLTYNQSEQGDAIAHAHSIITKRKAASFTVGAGLTRTMYDFILARGQTFVPMYRNNAAVPHSIPGCLIDAWFHASGCTVSLEFAPTLPPNKHQRLIEASDAVIQLGPDNDTILAPINADSVYQTLPYDGIPNPESTQVFNYKVITTLTNTWILTDSRGIPVPGVGVVPGNMPCQKLIRPNYATINAILPSNAPIQLIAKTAFIPYNDATGQRLFVAAQGAAGIYITKVYDGSAEYTGPAWLYNGVTTKPTRILVSNGGQKSSRVGMRSKNSTPATSTAEAAGLLAPSSSAVSLPSDSLL